MSSTADAASLIHATSVAIDGRAILLVGPSGIGKSDLALRLIDRGALLISDDQTMLSTIDGRLMAAPPATITGQMEVRGIGIVSMPHLPAAPVAAIVDLVAASGVERMPAPQHRRISGIAVPVLTLWPFEPSAPIKVEIFVASLPE